MIKGKTHEDGTSGHSLAYRPEVDGLRAIAVSAVILNHAQVPGLPGGFVGVDIFFVISGYLITAIITKDMLNGQFSIVDFYGRRIRRILPALFVMLAITAVAGFLIQSPKQFKDLGQASVAIATFTSNIYFPMKIGYFAEDAHYNPLLHTWSLAVEEQFYLFFPLLLLLLIRGQTLRRKRQREPGLAETARTPWLIVTVLGLIALSSLALAVRGGALNPTENFFSTPSRIWELLIGAILALTKPAWHNLTLRRSASARVVELTGLALIVGSVLWIDQRWNWPGLATLPVVLGTAMIIAAARSSTPVGRLLSSPPALFLGWTSYSAYLWHQPIFAMTRIAVGGPLGALGIVLTLTATFIVAWLSWKFVEKPFRGRHRPRHIAVFATAFAASAVFVVAGFSLHRAQGLPQRFDSAVQATAATMAYSPLRDACHGDQFKPMYPDRACRYFYKNTTWAVFSDSHGVELAYALAERLRPRKEGVLHLTFSGCAAALTYKHNEQVCNRWTRESLAWLERHPEVTHVMIVYRWSFDLFGDQTKTFPTMPTEAPMFLRELPPEQAREKFWQSFLELVARLRKAGKQVVVIRPIPDLAVSAERYVYGQAHDYRKTGMTRAQTDQRHAWINRHLDTLAAMPGVTLVDPRDTVCDTRNCWSMKDGRALYFDDNHLSLAGARQLLASPQLAAVLK